MLTPSEDKRGLPDLNESGANFIECDCQELDLWKAAVASATDLIGIFSFADFFKAIAYHIATLMDAGGAALVVYDGEEQLRYKLFYGLEELNHQAISEFRFPANQGTVGRALATGGPLYTPDYANSPDAMPEFVAAGVRANLVLPLRGPSGFVGAMTISWLNRQPKTLEPSGLMIVGMFAALVSSALYREALEDMLKQQSLHDALTGLPNRRLLMLHLAEAQDRAKRKQTMVAVAVIDLDGFKQVNDKFGHLAGDQVLVATAKCIKQNLRTTDMIARLGGDEFVVVLEDIKTIDEIELVFRRVTSAIKLQIEPDDQPGNIGASIGVALYPLNTADPEELLHGADAAMYAAKSAGGNRVVLADIGFKPIPLDAGAA